jgi:predicted nucleotidyltransferase
VVVTERTPQLLQQDALALLRGRRAEILSLARRRGVFNLHVFGSVARGEAGAASDFDFLAELDPGRTLIDLGGLQIDLQELLGRRVDLIEPATLRPQIRRRILAEAVAL